MCVNLIGDADGSDAYEYERQRDRHAGLKCEEAELERIEATTGKNRESISDEYWQHGGYPTDRAWRRGDTDSMERHGPTHGDYSLPIEPMPGRSAMKQDLGELDRLERRRDRDFLSATSTTGTSTTATSASPSWRGSSLFTDYPRRLHTKSSKKDDNINVKIDIKVPVSARDKKGKHSERRRESDEWRQPKLTRHSRDLYADCSSPTQELEDWRARNPLQAEVHRHHPDYQAFPRSKPEVDYTQEPSIEARRPRFAPPSQMDSSEYHRHDWGEIAPGHRRSRRLKEGQGWSEAMRERDQEYGRRGEGMQGWPEHRGEDGGGMQGWPEGPPPAYYRPPSYATFEESQSRKAKSKHGRSARAKRAEKYLGWIAGR